MHRAHAGGTGVRVRRVSRVLSGAVSEGLYEGIKSYIGMRPKFGIRNSEFGIIRASLVGTRLKPDIWLLKKVDGKGFFKSAEIG
jgi:hypothetical protein